MDPSRGIQNLRRTSIHPSQGCAPVTAASSVPRGSLTDRVPSGTAVPARPPNQAVKHGRPPPDADSVELSTPIEIAHFCGVTPTDWTAEGQGFDLRGAGEVMLLFVLRGR